MKSAKCLETNVYWVERNVRYQLFKNVSHGSTEIISLSRENFWLLFTKSLECNYESGRCQLFPSIRLCRIYFCYILAGDRSTSKSQLLLRLENMFVYKPFRCVLHIVNIYILESQFEVGLLLINWPTTFNDF